MKSFKTLLPSLILMAACDVEAPPVQLTVITEHCIAYRNQYRACMKESYTSLCDDVNEVRCTFGSLQDECEQTFTNYKNCLTYCRYQEVPVNGYFPTEPPLDMYIPYNYDLGLDSSDMGVSGVEATDMGVDMEVVDVPSSSDFAKTCAN